VIKLHLHGLPLLKYPLTLIWHSWLVGCVNDPSGRQGVTT